MSGYQLRYVPGTPYGERFPSIRYPARGAYPSEAFAEGVRQAMTSPDSFEIVPVNGETR